MIFSTVRETATTLSNVLDQLSDLQYTSPCATLSGSSISQHVRHVIEFFQCLLSGYETGEINYDKRRRDHLIEAEKEFAKQCLATINDNIYQIDKPMVLHASLGNEATSWIIPTTYYREIAYNIEHAIHHMAIIRIGITEISKIILPHEFGVASSTLKYQAECVR
jgi:hypothetical protein